MHDDMSQGGVVVNPTAIVTGGSRGIGLSMVDAFGDAGFRVLIGAREDTGMAEVLGERVRFLSCDVRSLTDHKALVRAAQDWSGRLDVFVNNAGYSAWRPLSEIDEDFLDRLLDTNLKGVFWGCQAAESALAASQGSIINISSLAGKRGSSNNSAYCASKFGVNGVTQALAKELGASGVRVNAVCPVLVRTDGLVDALQDDRSPAGGDAESFLANFAKSQSALGRLPSGREVGDACVYLASSQASAITGQCLNVDCGVFPQ
jgi:NAD(P)-dependent dehydrogenase (short-subunit alcohol dehydrogenase family)